MQCEEWADANSELFKEAHDETVHKNSYKRKLYELISASLKMIGLMADDFHGPVHLLRQNKAGHLVSKGHGADRNFRLALFRIFSPLP